MECGLIRVRGYFEEVLIYGLIGDLDETVLGKLLGVEGR